MAFEATRARAWVYDTLTGDATFAASVTGGMWLDLVPADKGLPLDINGDPAPFGIISIQSAPDHVTANQTRVWSDALILVKLYALERNAATLEAAADRADTLLQKKPAATTSRGGTALATYREQIQATTVIEAGRMLTLMQLFYRVPTQV